MSRKRPTPLPEKYVTQDPKCAGQLIEMPLKVAPPRISPDLATRIAAEIDRKLIESGSSRLLELIAEIIERVGNAN